MMPTSLSGNITLALTLFAVCGLATTAAPASAKSRRADNTPKGFLLKTIQWQGTTYRYLVYVPADYTRDHPWPTILFLHGSGECGTDGLKPLGVGIGTHIMRHAERWPFLVIIPQKPEVRDTWAQYDDLLMAMLKKTEREYRVDTTRLYLTGLSQGGFGTWALAAKHPDLFAAAAPICGIGDPNQASELAKIPLWVFHGAADPVVSPEADQKTVDAVKAAGGDIQFTLYPGVGHDSWDNAYDDPNLPQWFLQHQRPAK
ncbi:prolyl oligopeptidase family serine peptidase [Chthonomonas calidirosea]|uniref:carboxylesterase family protein n=1 Tax=Chthonomonas calidirosea TaxID=454171 RepID=UPI0006EC8143|nr:prolyl oligopeptidase family serine peptidase [Chthonomonas calidirosea]CEK15641.1 predicted peptidase [Chthonomonas calidirosea]